MKIQKIITFAFALMLSALFTAFNATAQINADYAAVPATSTEFTTPQIMMSISADHQYFFKAYSDYSDLDDNLDDDTTNNDGPDLTYKNTYEYYGYFDTNKCYTYNTSTDRYEPQALQTTAYYCDNVSGDWSGNFLNWATMTRMDVVRKIFYGGFRSTDEDNLTVLERAHLPTDAHSFAKYYNGDDIDKLTPFDSSDVNWDDDGNTIAGTTTVRTDNVGFDDRVEGITICNTTPDLGGNATSQNSAAAPVMRVVKGNFQLWAANERWQCTWDNEEGDNYNGNVLAISGIDADGTDPDQATDGLPPAGTTEYDRIVRVEVCSDTALIDLGDTSISNVENCQEYPDGNYKPVGIFHEYGEEGQIEFGLMTGGFSANTEGGVLRKNIREFTDEVNQDTDGTFTGTAGIITNLNALRMFGYRYDNGTYFGGNSEDACNFQQTDINHGTECFSWGNPISEILKESVKYLSGGTATAAFNQDDSGKIDAITNSIGTVIYPGLSVEAWVDPIEASNSCAAMTQIVINASVSSYDENVDLTGFPNALAVDTYTDIVGATEGIHGGSYFVGESDVDNNLFCTQKTVNTLSSVRGICPEAPTVEGSYAAAGIAYYAKTTDLRPGYDGDQTVSTLGITLATNSAVINVPLGEYGAADSINIVPAYRLLVGDEGGGALVDFKVVNKHEETFAGSGIYTGEYYLNWEDSEQGGDFDNDVWGILRYELDIAAGEIEVFTNTVSESTGNDQLFGFITSGTTQDGFHAYSGIEGANYPDDGSGVDPTGVTGCIDCRAGNEGGAGQRGEQSYVFTIDTTNVGQELETPLYYAAKYGSFDETGTASNTNDLPDLDSEFDIENNLTGAAGGDGIPDGYYAATSPQTLFDSISRALEQALNVGENSGSAASNLGSSGAGGDIIIQAIFYEKEESDTDDRAVAWTGDVFAYFIDGSGNFREDTNANGTLDPADMAFEYDNTGTDLLVNRFTVDAVDGSLTAAGTVSVTDLDPIWRAGENLSELNNGTIINNRTYTTEVGGTAAGRYVFTWVDVNGDGEVQDLEVGDFEGSEIDATAFGQGFEDFLNITGTIDQAELVDYIRGYEDDTLGFRNRTIVEGSTEVVKRLGDVVSSTTVIVGAPTEDYDETYRDSTYEDFRNQYADRRTVVYTGANDGLLHAFNAGFKTLPQGGDDFQVGFSLSGLNSEVAHPLGAELWSYAPKNLLPHMQWLASPDYLHTYYMDGEPAVFDVNIFADSTTHPHGWGTILVAGMGLGGGDFPLAFDADSDGDTSNDFTRSAYVVLDVTNPEVPPVLLGEITHEDLNHTTLKPTLLKRRAASRGFNYETPTQNKWTLVFGSGPDNRINYTSSVEPVMFTIDLELDNGRLDNTVPTSHDIDGLDTGALGFVGGIASANWGYDASSNFAEYVDDVVYFGTVEQGTGFDDQSGDIFRLIPGAGGTTYTTNTFLNINRPITSDPLPLVVDGANFVYAGTGRYLDQLDADTSEQDYYVGVIEDFSDLTNPFVISDLLNVTDVVITQYYDDTGAITSVEATGGFSGDASAVDAGVDDAVTTFEELSDYMIDLDDDYASAGSGWYRTFASGGGAPNERVVSDSDSVYPLLAYATFLPEDSICTPSVGTSELYVVDLVTGTASEFAPLQDPIAAGTAGNRTAEYNRPIGSGVPSDVNFIPNESGDATVTVSTSESENRKENARISQDIPLTRFNWREILQ